MSNECVLHFAGPLERYEISITHLALAFNKVFADSRSFCPEQLLGFRFTVRPRIWLFAASIEDVLAPRALVPNMSQSLLQSLLFLVRQ